MKTSKFIKSGAFALAASMLFAGCAGITHEPKVDVSKLKDIDENDFFEALEKIGIDERDTDVMEDTSFSFDYYFDDYDHIFDSKDFSGIKSYEVGTNTGYLLIDGRYDNQVSGTYTPYHDALFLKGDTVVFAMASDYDVAIEKEVNNFLDALGYPHP